MTTLELWDESVRLLRQFWGVSYPAPGARGYETYRSVARELIPLGLRTPHEIAYGGTQ